MAVLTFDDDSISGTSQEIPGSDGEPYVNARTVTYFGGLSGASLAAHTQGSTYNSSFSYNPFAAVNVTDSGGTDAVHLRLRFTSGTAPGGTTYAQAGTLFHVSDGNTLSLTLGQATFTWGTHTAAETQAWLRSIVVVGNGQADGFTITLRAFNEAGTTLQSINTINFQSVITCFLKGTMIATPAGERLVEALQPGDLVTTLDGTAKAVKWVGHRTYEAGFGAQEAFVRPVLFTAGSLGGGLPARDLRVSANHGMLLDGVMVPAAALVNGASIVRDTVASDITYFHVELDSHEAIFAEGAPSETFVDLDSRAIFDNADEYGLLYGTASARPAAQPRLEEGFQLAAIRRRLAGFAGVTMPAANGVVMGNLERIENGVLHGWLVDAAGADAVEAEVLVDGEVVGRVVANRYRADLDQAGISGGIGGFTVALPASAERLEQVSLRRVVDGQVLVAPQLEVVQG